MNPDKYRDKMVILAKSFTTYAEKILGFASWSVCYYEGNIPVEYSLPEPLCTYVIDIEKDGELVPIYLYPLVKKSPCKKGKDLYIGLEVDGKMIGTYFTNEQIEWYGDILLFESFKTAIGGKVPSFGDKVRSMTNEQLAEWIYSHDEKSEKNGRWTKEQILEYINRPAKCI